jgi:hypothetical protein
MLGYGIRSAVIDAAGHLAVVELVGRVPAQESAPTFAWPSRISENAIMAHRCPGLLPRVRWDINK